MHIWFELLSREALMLALLAALGAAPAAILASRFDVFARLAMAPVLGICVATAIYTTLLWFFAARVTAWTVVPVALLSLLGAGAILRRSRRSRPPDHLGNPAEGSAPRHTQFTRLRSTAFPVLQLLLVCFAASFPVLLTLHQRSSVGPATYQVYDAVGYVAEGDGAMQQSLHTASTAVKADATVNPTKSFVRVFWQNYARGYQEVDTEPFAANVDALVGFGATQTQSPFLVAFLVAGALAMYGALRRVTKGAGWAATLGGSLFGGAFFLQLFFDGSEAAICGLGLMIPLLIVGWDTLEDPRPTNLVLSALLWSGLFACYPVYLPDAFFVAVVAGVMRIVMARPLRMRWAGIRRGVAQLMAFAVMVVLFDGVAFLRAIRYWTALGNGVFNVAALNFPRYSLSPRVVPGWLTQTRYFYDLSFTRHSTLSTAILAGAVPALLLVLALVGALTRRVGGLALSLVLIAGLLGAYENVSKGCSYCEDRTLLPVSPGLIFLIGLGMASVVQIVRSRMRSGRGRLRLPSRFRAPAAASAGVVFALVILAPTSYTAAQARSDIATNTFVLPAQERAMLSTYLPSNATLDLEGFDEGARSPGEQVLTYEMADEITGSRASMAGDANDNSAMAYLGVEPDPGPQFDPNYQYVLSRVSQIRTDRKLIASAIGISLSKRVAPLDVTLDFGAVVATLPDRDPSGVAWARAAPVKFVIAGGDAVAPAFVEILFINTTPAVTVSSPTLRAVKRGPTTTAVCLAAAGAAPVRSVEVSVSPPVGVQIAAMSVTPSRCPPMIGLT